MQKILICTHNKGKFREICYTIKESGLNLEPISLTKIKFDRTIEEKGTTYEENAALKARILGEKTGLLTLGDDAGIEVDALEGMPGLHSRRFFKSEGETRNKELLSMIKDKKNKSAKFVAVVAIYNPKNKSTKAFRGEETGVLVEAKGKAPPNLGYDSIFKPLGKGLTYAELGLEEKTRTSHRAIAVKKACSYLRTLL